MTAKIRVRNFQAIGDVTVEANGLTVITGRSNLGKSGFLRAVAAMLFGLEGEYFIRRGEDFTGGAISIDDPGQPLKIVWRKVATKARKPNLQPSLEINGVKHTKIGKGHKDLTRPFGVIEIETTAKRIRPQIAYQGESIFLVDDNETTAAEVFKMLGRVDVITEAQRQAKKDLKTNEDRRKIRSGDREEARLKAEEFKNVPQLRADLDQLTQDLAGLTNNQTQTTYIQLLDTLSSLEPSPLPEPPSFPTKPNSLQYLPLLEETIRLQPRNIPATLNLVADFSAILTANMWAGHLKNFIDDEEDLRVTRADVAVTMAEVTMLEGDRRRLEAELKVCPTCSQPFKAHENHQAKS